MNYWLFTGNVSSDPVVRTTPAGQTVCNFDVAVGIYRKNKENEAIFVKVSAWERLANYAQNARKGTKVCVCGSLEPPTAYIKKGDGSPAANLSVRAIDLFFTNPNGVGAARNEANNEPPAQQNSNASFSGFDPNAGGWFGNTPY